MSDITMTVGEFSDLLDRLGSDLTQWPDTQRHAAETLLAQSPGAAQALTEALKLADAIKTSQPKAPANLADRIIAAAGSEKPKN